MIGVYFGDTRFDHSSFLGLSWFSGHIFGISMAFFMFAFGIGHFESYHYPWVGFGFQEVVIYRFARIGFYSDESMY